MRPLPTAILRQICNALAISARGNAERHNLPQGKTPSHISTPTKNYQHEKIPADAETNIDKLRQNDRDLFTKKGVFREKEWKNMISQSNENAGHTVITKRGAKARAIRKKYSR